jgi:hypothetical protein
MAKQNTTCMSLSQVSDFVALLDRVGFDARLVGTIINFPRLAKIMHQAVINEINSTAK